MPGSFRLCRIAGIDIDLNVSWFVIVVLLTCSLATSWFPTLVPHQAGSLYWLLGGIATLLLFASVLAHEMAHSLAAKLRGLPVTSITLFIFGGVSDIEQEPQRAGIEFQMAFVGPLTSLLLGTLCWGLGGAVGEGMPLVTAMLVYLAIMNLLLGLFNLIPGFPLDGGRVLRSIIWGITGNLRTATRWAASIGQGIALLGIIGGVALVFAGDIFDGLWFGFIGWFLFTAAQSAYRQVLVDALLRGLRVHHVMTPVTVAVPADRSLRDAVEGYVLPSGSRSLPVTQDGRFIGLLTLGDIANVPRERWVSAVVQEIMVPLDLARLHAVSPQQDAREVLSLLDRYNIQQVPVVANGHLVGIISRDAILRCLGMRRGLDRFGKRSEADMSRMIPEHLLVHPK